MEKILHVASTFKSHENDDGSVMIRGMASTDHSDRAGDVIAAEAWTKGGLDNFKNNPVILFNHDYDKPIGRATGVNVTKNGLELEAKISKSAPAAVCELVKDGVLGAFSVGFKVKDADYVKETDGLMIKDAELFEVSVVSVPCNQAATFSLAKSFDSQAEYEEFKKTFTNRVDLPGQSLTKDDSKESNLVSDAPKHVEQSTNKETKMSEDNTSAIDLEAFAKKVAEETAAKIAMKQAEQKAADEAQEKAAADAVAEKAAQDEQVKQTIRTGIETGAERLQADMQADFAKAKESEVAELVKKYEADVAEKNAELEAMRKSKYHFADNGARKEMDSKAALEARVLGAITNKGYETDFAKSFMEKQGADYGTPSTAGQLDQVTIDRFAMEVQLESRIAPLFEEIQVNSSATTMPFMGAVSNGQFLDEFDIDTANSRTDTVGGTNGQIDIGNRTIVTHRLVSGTFIDNDQDESTLVSFLPMITQALVRSQARGLDDTLLFGTTAATQLGLAGGDGSDKGTGLMATPQTILAQRDGSPAFGSDDLVLGRSAMGAYGYNPADLAYVVSMPAYYKLLEDSNFLTIDKAGSDIATNINGQLGTLFGSPVIVTDQLPGTADASTAAVVVNTSNFKIARLKSMGIETEYSVAKQRNVLVASQAFGFKAVGHATLGAAACVYTADA